jgi:hypothetical protein
VARVFPALLVSLAFVVLAGARPAAAYDKSAFVAPKDQALLVFIQNIRDDESMTYMVFDRDRQCLAEVGGREAEIAQMPPGSYSFYISGYKTQRVDMELAPGRTYFIRIFSYDKVVMRRSDVSPVQRGTDSYMQVKFWLQGARVTKASDDPCHGKTIKKQARKVTKQILGADVDWDQGDELYHLRYSLLATDGFKADEIDWL